MGVLKCLSGRKSFTFVNSSVQEFRFCFGYVSRKLDSLIVFVSLFSELCDLFYGCGPEGEDVVNQSFSDERF